MERIKEYFINEKKMTEAVATLLTKPLLRYEDVKNEFLWWLENRSYDCPNPLKINGYTAADIAKIAPHLDGSGVYHFLITLRDNPEKAKIMIADGFPRK